MGLSIEEKKAAVTEVGVHVAQAQAIVLAEYRGLTVKEMTDLRAKARKSGVYLRVLKNTIGRRAVSDTPFSGLADHMVGALAYGMSDDPVAVAKLLAAFAKGNDKLVLKAGAMANQVLSSQEVKKLASMPSRDELIAMLMRTMQAPVTKFVQTLNEVPSKFVRALAAVRDQKAAQEKAAA